MTASPAHSHSPPSRLPSILDLLADQTEMCEKLEQCCGAILARLEAGDLENLSSLLAERDPLIRRLDSFNRRFIEACPSWPGFLASLSEAQREQAVEGAGRFNHSLAQVRDADAAIARHLRQRQSSISEALAEIVTVKQTRSAYRGSAASGQSVVENRFMDRQG